MVFFLPLGLLGINCAISGDLQRCVLYCFLGGRSMQTSVFFKIDLRIMELLEIKWLMRFTRKYEV